MGRERDGLAERERQDQERAERNSARQVRAATSFDAATAESEPEEEEESKPKAKARSSRKKAEAETEE